VPARPREARAVVELAPLDAADIAALDAASA
jgi:hypothetical protein